MIHRWARAGLLASALTFVACLAVTAPAGAETPTGGDDGGDVTAQGTVAAASTGSGAVTYDPAVVPVGAHLAVEVHDDGDGGTEVTLDAEGLKPGRGYAAHAHMKPCGPAPTDAGPHFQDKADPAATPQRPSTDPAYANPRNEVWLDLHTDADGNGHAEADVPFPMVENRSPRSVVLHDGEMTMTDAGHAGTAGGRAACITLPTS